MVRDDQMGPEMRWVQVRPKGAATSITLVICFPTMATGPIKGASWSKPDDLDGDVAVLRSRGVTIEGGIQSQP